MDAQDRALIEQNQLFRGVEFSCVEYMLEKSELRTLPAGEVLLQPEVGNRHLYLILAGELRVHLIGPQALEYATLHAGECTGEISLVDGKNPSARVIAQIRTRVLAIPHDTVWSLVDQSHEVARNLLAIIAGRMRNDNSALLSSHQQRTQYEHQATVDALTGVHNRHWMDDAFPRVLHRCALNGQHSALMVLDIDLFKRVNDTYGHLMGDAVLKALANVVQHNLRPHDLLVRYGGEEFAILLPGTEADEAQAIAERLRRMVAANEVVYGKTAIKVTVSIGLAIIAPGGAQESSFAAADQALYRAKQAGRDRVVRAD